MDGWGRAWWVSGDQEDGAFISGSGCASHLLVQATVPGLMEARIHQRERLYLSGMLVRIKVLENSCLIHLRAVSNSFYFHFVLQIFIFKTFKKIYQ